MHMRHQPSPQPQQEDIDADVLARRAGREHEPVIVRTACGQPWQLWQAPPIYREGHLGVLPGPDEEPTADDAVVDCPVCAQVVREYEA